MKITRFNINTRNIISNHSTKKNIFNGTKLSFGKDSVQISKKAKQLYVQSNSGKNVNRNIDRSINLQNYIDSAAESNKQALENAGTSINRNAVKMQDIISALRNALNDKYAKASAAAGSYENTENYLQDKYFNVGSSIYEADLTEAERSAGYQNEKSYLKTGHVAGVNSSDSLFRGLQINGDAVDNSRLQNERAVINKQISNITEQAGITDIPDTCKLTVAPYDYKITVEGVADDMKEKMENALNVGDNGKNLFFHINHMSVQDGCNSIQQSKEKTIKYQAYHFAEEFAGVKLNEMTEKNGTYYTANGENVIDLAKKGIENDESVPFDFKAQMKNWVSELISTVANMGWNNTPDKYLSILFNQNKLKDYGQDIIYDGVLDWNKQPWSFTAV